jgi:hypothetical protein
MLIRSFVDVSEMGIDWILIGPRKFDEIYGFPR